MPRREIEQANANIAATCQEWNAKIEAERSAHSKTRAALDDRTVRGALTGALRQHAAAKQTLAGAVALLQREWAFKVSADQAFVAIGGDVTPIGRAVQRWLQGDAGCAFAATKPGTKAGLFAGMFGR